MRLINLLPNPMYFFYFGLIALMLALSPLSSFMFEPVTGYNAFWSPDGSKLAIIAGIDSRDFEIFVVDGDGSNLIQLTTVSSAWIEYVRWSEDNQTIYYQIAPLQPNNDTWYYIDLQSYPYSASLLGNNAANPAENPITTQEEIDATVSTNATSDQYYAVSTCDKYGDDVDYVLLNNCWHDLDVYSIATDELIWSIGRHKYRMAKFGILQTISALDFLSVSLVSFFIGLCIALLRRFNWVDKPKRKIH